MFDVRTPLIPKSKVSRLRTHRYAYGFRLLATCGTILSTLLLLVTEASPSSGASLQGTAIDIAGVPLNNVTVSLFSSERDWHTNAARGDFEIADLPAGKYSLEAYKVGFQTVVLNKIVLSAGQSQSLVIHMAVCNNSCDVGCSPPPVTYSDRPTNKRGGLLITVISPNQEPLPRADVMLSTAADPNPVARTTTDMQGHAEISALPPGPYTVAVYATGYRNISVNNIRLLTYRVAHATISVQLYGTSKACQ